MIKSARSQVDEYLHDECERALNENNRNMIAEMRRVQGEHEAKVTQRVIDFAALIENNFYREALIREAANRIEALVMAEVTKREALMQYPRGEVVISVCDRPHAD